MSEAKLTSSSVNLMSDFEPAACPFCSGERSELFYEAPDRFAPRAGPAYKIHRCLQCNMIYLNPRPVEEKSGQFYEHADYLPFASIASSPSLFARIYELVRRANLRWKRRIVTEFLQRNTGQRTPSNEQQATLLDVGCGTGEFLVEMKTAGWQVEGLERDERAARWATEHYQIPATVGRVEQLADSTQQYDLITMWHVLEHLYHPGAALEILARRLRKGGCLLIAVPNIAGVDARVYKSNWVALDAPRHVNHFSLETLGRLTSKHGLTLRWWRQLPLDNFFNALMSEKLTAQRGKGRFYLWPLRLLRAFGVACASYLGGSHTPFSYASYGASLVCFFERSRRNPAGPAGKAE
jgi:2-polyprenyl-3-methyl-5-hydroxy-6-metoxy-1,4-benzoquinol methylase